MEQVNLDRFLQDTTTLEIHLSKRSLTVTPPQATVGESEITPAQTEQQRPNLDQGSDKSLPRCCSFLLCQRNTEHKLNKQLQCCYSRLELFRRQPEFTQK